MSQTSSEVPPNQDEPVKVTSQASTNSPKKKHKHSSPKHSPKHAATSEKSHHHHKHSPKHAAAPTSEKSHHKHHRKHHKEHNEHDSKGEEREHDHDHHHKKKKKKLAEVLNDGRAPQDVRIAVIGNVDSGKSTMIGVLTSGEMDDGRGYARSKILRHNHERSNGRTSCSSQHILGFSQKRKPIHQPVSISATPKQKTTAWSTVVKNSNNIVTFIDLAGHEKYLKTTISGLTGCFPDYAFIVVGANMGISKMTREHIQVAIALSIPLFVVVTKIDIAPETVLRHTLKQLAKLLKSPTCNKMPIIMRKKKDIDTCFEKDMYLERICPVFLVSAVGGEGIDRVNNFLAKLRPRTPWKTPLSTLCEKTNAAVEHQLHPEIGDPNAGAVAEPTHKVKETENDLMVGELEIDETFAVKGVGIVVSGTVTGGRIMANQKLFLGPFTDGSFKEILTKSVHIKRVVVDFARAGESCSVAFRFTKRKEIVDRAHIRKGMVAVSDSLRPAPVWAFQANILVLHHPTTINPGYQPVVHCGNIRQTATILKMSKERLRSGDSALVDMKFLCNPEFLHLNRAIIIREGNTKCIGKVTQLFAVYDANADTFTEYLKRSNHNDSDDIKIEDFSDDTHIHGSVDGSVHSVEQRNDTMASAATNDTVDTTAKHKIVKK